GYSVQLIENNNVAAGDVDSISFQLFPLTPVTVQNPGFETGNMTGWTNLMGYGGVYAHLYLGSSSHSGAYWSGKAVLNSNGLGRAYQIINVVPGVEYNVSCFLCTDSYAALRIYEYPSNCIGHLGIDPAGGTNPTA